MLPSSARFKKSFFLLDTFSKSIIFKPQVNWWSYWCFISLPFPTWLLQDSSKYSYKCLTLSAFKKDFYAFMFSSLALLSLIFLSLNFFKPYSHVFEPYPLSLTIPLSGLILSSFYTFLTLIPLYQIFVCKKFALFQSYQCNAFWSKLVGGFTKTILVI